MVHSRAFSVISYRHACLTATLHMDVPQAIRKLPDFSSCIYQVLLHVLVPAAQNYVSPPGGIPHAFTVEQPGAESSGESVS